MSTVRLRFEALVADTLSNPASGFGYQATKFDFGESVDITLEKSGSQFIVWLRPVEHATSCYGQTVRFKIGHRGDPPDSQGYALLDAACVAIAAWERTLSEDADAQLFDAAQVMNAPGSGSTVTAFRHPGRPALEWLAVRSGLKPACRYVVWPEEASQIAERARAEGFFAYLTEAKAFVAGFSGDGVWQGQTTLVHFGRTDQASALAAEAERTMTEACNRGDRVSPSQVRALGAALGYPPCCIEAFIPIRDLSMAAIRFHALQRTMGCAEALLNNIVESRALISHSLCRYDCESSLRYARSLLDELDRSDAGSANEIVQRLSGLVVLFRTGGSLRLAPVTNFAARVYAFQRVEEAGTGPLLELWRAVASDADGLEILDGEVRFTRASDEIARLDLRPDEVQIQLFARSSPRSGPGAPP